MSKFLRSLEETMLQSEALQRALWSDLTGARKKGSKVRRVLRAEGILLHPYPRWVCGGVGGAWGECVWDLSVRPLERDMRR
jgi:hypothetical protein